jgi:succinate-semialdehyde dehydrogenase/glutarate-semialdehyde dehydrogenase
MIATLNPATGEVSARFSPHSPQQVERRLEAAAAAQRAWRDRPIAERTDLVRRIGAALRADAPRLATLITEERGKPLAEARAEVE